MTIFVQDVGEDKLIGKEEDGARSHKLRVEHEERLDFPGKKLSITFSKKCPLTVQINRAYSFKFSEFYFVVDSTHKNGTVVKVGWFCPNASSGIGKESK